MKCMIGHGRLRRLITVLLLMFLFLGVVVPNTFAKLGVGVGTSNVQIDEPLLPGTISVLPSISVMNTGTVASQYSLSISYHEKQPELMPNSAWFEFKPQTFDLDPGEVKIVDIRLNLPVTADPGDYFAYIEASPIQKDSAQGESMIGIAAASKLYFTIEPANLWQGIVSKISSFFRVYEPWPQRTIALLVTIILIIVIKNLFKIHIDFSLPWQRKNDLPIQKVTDQNDESHLSNNTHSDNDTTKTTRLQSEAEAKSDT